PLSSPLLPLSPPSLPLSLLFSLPLSLLFSLPLSLSVPLFLPLLLSFLSLPRSPCFPPPPPAAILPPPLSLCRPLSPSATLSLSLSLYDSHANRFFIPHSLTHMFSPSLFLPPFLSFSLSLS